MLAHGRAASGWSVLLGLGLLLAVEVEVEVGLSGPDETMTTGSCCCCCCASTEPRESWWYHSCGITPRLRRCLRSRPSGRASWI